MKKPLLLFITLFTISLVNAQLVKDAEFEGGLFKFKVTTEEAGDPNTVTLTGTATDAVLPDDLVIPATVTENGIEYAITLIANNAFKNNATITSLVIEGNPALGSQSFRNCTSLKTIDLPLLTSIGIAAEEEGGNETGLVFWQCTALETVNMPKMENIYTGAFNKCSVLTSITFPSTMTYLSSQNANMFKFCTSLTEIIVEYTTFIALEKDVHANVSIFNDQILAGNATLTIPAGTLAAYQAAPVWKDFSNFIEAQPTAAVNSIITNESFSAYPNPVVDVLSFSTDAVVSVDIYNTLGAKVASKNAANGVDMSNLVQGVYYVVCKNKNDEAISTIKVVKN